MQRPRLLHCATLVALCAASLSCAPDTSEPGHPVDLPVTVFYDQDDDGIRSAYEIGRVPNVTLKIEGTTQRGVSASRTGELVIPDVPQGRATLVPSGPDALPPFFEAPVAVSTRVPPLRPTEFPVSLPIGDNARFRYLTFGDSITDGEGATSEATSYIGVLETRLADHFAHARVVVDAVPGSFSDEGAQRIEASLAHYTPAYVTILYGTNDWVDYTCHVYECYTVESLRTMIRAARANHTLPIVGTIPPANPAHPKAPPARNRWIAEMNDDIRAMAVEEGAVIAEVHEALMAEGDLPSLFVDHVHPNDRGHALVAGAFFQAITRPPVAVRATSAPSPTPRTP